MRSLENEELAVGGTWNCTPFVPLEKDIALQKSSLIEKLIKTIPQIKADRLSH